MGFQNLRFNPRELEIYREVNEETYIINRIAPYVEQRMAKLTNLKFEPSIIPDKTDDALVKAAELSEMLYKHYWKVQDKDSKEKTSEAKSLEKNTWRCGSE